MRRLADERSKPFDERRDLAKDLFGTQRLLTVENDYAVCLFEISLDAHLQHIRGKCIGDTNSAPARFIFVGGTDAAERRSDLLVAEPFFRSVIQCSVIRHYQMSPR